MKQIESLAITLLLTLIPLTSGLAAKLSWLGDLGGGFSTAQSVSADGSVVVGYSYLSDGSVHAFRWTASEGIRDLGTLGGKDSWGYGISADGSVVVGKSFLPGNNLIHAFRWSAVEGMQDLGAPGGQDNSSWAWSASADGSVVVGWSDITRNRAFRWTAAAGMQDLGGLAIGAKAWDVSADGSIVVGGSSLPYPWRFGSFHAVRWTPSGIQDLGALSKDGDSMAAAVSADGSIVVGWSSYSDSGWHAFRWTATEGMQDLGVGMAHDVSRDGSVVVGESYNHAFRWTASSGMQDLNVVYAELLRDGSMLITANGISPDGRFIVGYGHNASKGPEGFLLDTAPLPAHEKKWAYTLVRDQQGLITIEAHRSLPVLEKGIFVAARIGRDWWFKSPKGWVLWDGDLNSVQPYLIGRSHFVLESGLNPELFRMELEVYIGEGDSLAEVITTGNYEVLLTSDDVGLME